MILERIKNMIKNIEKNSDLFERIISILEEAKSNVARSVNFNMVIAYWLIGRELVIKIQDGEKRAEYGKIFWKNSLYN